MHSVTAAFLNEAHKRYSLLTGAMQSQFQISLVSKI